MRPRGNTLWHAPSFALLCQAIVDRLLPVLSRRGSGRPVGLSRRAEPIRTREVHRLRVWRNGLGILTICSPLLASFDTVNADELLYLKCNLSGTELLNGRSKPYSDTVVFKVNLQTKEGWEAHPNRFHHPRRITAEIDEHAIRLSRGNDSDVRSSDISYRIDRSDGSIVFSYRVTWYYGHLSDDSLTLATGACERASTVPPYVKLPMRDLHFSDVSISGFPAQLPRDAQEGRPTRSDDGCWFLKRLPSTDCGRSSVQFQALRRLVPVLFLGQLLRQVWPRPV
jgi:hypothetical protein